SDYQRTADVAVSSAPGKRTGPFLQNFTEFEVGSESGYQAKYHGSDKRQPCNENERTQVEAEIIANGKVSARGKKTEVASRRPCDANAKSAPDTCKHKALQHKLTHQLASARTHGHANGQFSTAPGRTQEKKVRNVGENDQEYSRAYGEKES